MQLFFLKQKFPTPTTLIIKKSEVDIAVKKLNNFPYYAKFPYGRGGTSVTKINSNHDLIQYINKIEWTKELENSGGFLIQESIEGQQISAVGVFKDGAMLAVQVYENVLG